jgi:hypothetical protein
MRPVANSLEYEKLLFRYSSALERGDFEAVAAVLELAQADPELERMLLELNQAYTGMTASQPEATGASFNAPGESATARRTLAGWLGRPRHFFNNLLAGLRQPQPARRWALLATGLLVVLLAAVGVFELTAILITPRQMRAVETVDVKLLGLVEATAAAAPTQPPAATQAPAELPAIAYPAPGTGGLGSRSQPYPLPQGVAPSGSEHLIVRDGSLNLVVTDTRKTRDAIQDLVAGMESAGAYVVSSSETNSGPVSGSGDIQPVIQMFLRVPAERFEAVMDALAAMAVRVDARNETAQDVTAEYVDLQAQLEQLQAARQRLLEIMKATQNTDDLLRAEGLLTQRETEIASIQGRMKYLQQTAQLSSIQVVLNPSVLSQPIQPAGWDPAATARLALGRLVKRFQAFTDWLINFSIATLPWLIAALLLIFGVLRLAGRRRPG